MGNGNTGFLTREEAVVLISLLDGERARDSAIGGKIEEHIEGLFDRTSDFERISEHGEVYVISEWQELLSEQDTRIEASPRKRRWLKVSVIIAVTVVAAGFLLFGATNWLGGSEPVQVAEIKIDNAGIDRMRQQERELNSIWKSHRATIAELETRIALHDASALPGSKEQVSELTAELEEMKAEARALEVAANLLDKQQGAAEREVVSLPEQPYAMVEDPPADDKNLDNNPYGTVSLASVLGDGVSEEAYQTGKDESGDNEPEAEDNGRIDELIESAVARPKAEHGAGADDPGVNSLPEPAPHGLPERPSRESVQKVMRSMKPAIKRCGGAPYERLVVELTVVGATGRVKKSRTIDSTYAGTPIGACAAKAVRLARFPKFKRESVVIKYPFEL